MRIVREKQKESGVRLRDDGVLIPVMEKFSPRHQTHVFAQHTETRGNGMQGNKGPVKALIHVPEE